MNLIPLTNENIADAVAKVKADTEAANVKREDAVWLTLYVEELLLEYRDKMKAERPFCIVQKKRFGSLLTEIYIKGKEYNLVNNEYSEAGITAPELLESLVNVHQVATGYCYKNRINIISITQECESKFSKIKIPPAIISVVLAVVTWLLLPEKTAAYVSEGFITPVYDVLLGILKGAIGPVVFTSLVCGICALNDMETMNRIGKKLILRILCMTLIMISFASVVCFFFFRGGGTSETAFNPAELLSLFLSIIPTNLFTPFIEGELIQIVIIGMITGIILLEMGEKMTVFKSAMGELKLFFFRLMGIVTKPVPVIIYLSLLDVLINTDISSLASVWKVLVVDIIIYGLFAGFLFFYTSARTGITPKELINAFAPAVIIATSSTSGTAALPAFYDGFGEKGLHADEKFYDFWIPVSHSLFSASTIFAMVVYSFYCANQYNISISIGWIVIMFITVTQLGMSTPKVPGGLMTTITALLVQLGMPTESIGIIMVANVFLVNINVGIGTTIRLLDGVLFAWKEGAIKTSKEVK